MEPVERGMTLVVGQTISPTVSVCPRLALPKSAPLTRSDKTTTETPGERDQREKVERLRVAVFIRQVALEMMADEKFVDEFAAVPRDYRRVPDGGRRQEDQRAEYDQARSQRRISKFRSETGMAQ